MDKNQLATREYGQDSTGDEDGAGRCRRWRGAALWLLLAVPAIAYADPASNALRQLLEYGGGDASAELTAAGHSGTGLKAIWQLGGRISVWSAPESASAAFPADWVGGGVLGHGARLEQAATVRYDSPSFFGLNAVTEYTGGQSQAAQPLGLWSLGVGYRLGSLSAEYGHQEIFGSSLQGVPGAGARGSVDHIGAAYSLGLWTPRISFARGYGLAGGGAPETGSYQQWSMGLDYSLSRGTKAQLSYGQLRLGGKGGAADAGDTGAAGSQNTLELGITHHF
jgi:predicted porin